MERTRWTHGVLGLALLLAPCLASAASPGAAPGAFVVDGEAASGIATAVDPCVLPADAPESGPAAGPSLAASAADAAVPAAEGQAATRRPMAFEYSDGYQTRLKIHKYASYATVPLFAAQFIVGQKLYDGSGSDGTRSAHTALAAGTGVLFGANTITGVWNLIEGRKDPNRKTKVVVHSILMLLADAGFVATGALAPDHEEFGFGESGGGVSRSTHRKIALSSMGVATLSYLIMLIH